MPTSKLTGGKQHDLSGSLSPSAALDTASAPAELTPARRNAVNTLIYRSITSYPCSCPCPYNLDRAGGSLWVRVTGPVRGRLGGEPIIDRFGFSAGRKLATGNAPSRTGALGMRPDVKAHRGDARRRPQRRAPGSIVILASLLIALGLGAFLQRTKTGRIIRATAENRDMAEGLGVNAGRIFAVVFTVGCMLGTVGGALVVPSAASSLSMAVELVVEAFAVVVIGGLGSMRGAFVGALIVGLMRAGAIYLMPEVEMLSIYLVVIAVLILRPAGLFGRAAA